MHPFQHDGCSISGDSKWPQEMLLYFHLIYEELTGGFWCAWPSPSNESGQEWQCFFVQVKKQSSEKGKQLCVYERF